MFLRGSAGLVALVLAAAPGPARLLSQQRPLPRFADYRVAVSVGPSHPPVWDGVSSADSADWADIIQDSLGHGPNFAGHFLLLGRSESLAGGELLVLDATTGKLLFPGLNPLVAIDYRPWSTLLIMDPADQLRQYCDSPSHPPECELGLTTDYLVWGPEGFTEIASVPFQPHSGDSR